MFLLDMMTCWRHRCNRCMVRIYLWFELPYSFKQLNYRTTFILDNLDSYTYEIFEKDPVKYIYYQRAIERALVNKVSEAEIAIKKVNNDVCCLLLQFTFVSYEKQLSNPTISCLHFRLS